MLEQLINRSTKHIGEAVSFVFLASVIVIFIEVILRYLLNSPTIWAHETTTALTAIGFIFGGAYSIYRKDQIAITSIYALTSDGVKRVLDFFSIGVELFFLSGLSYAAWVMVTRSWRSMETSGSAWNPPTPVIVKTALLAGLVLMVFQAISKLLALFSDEQKNDGDASNGH